MIHFQKKSSRTKMLYCYPVKGIPVLIDRKYIWARFDEIKSS